jgi:hypothetical protein
MLKLIDLVTLFELFFCSRDHYRRIKCSSLEAG